MPLYMAVYILISLICVALVFTDKRIHNVSIVPLNMTVYFILPYDVAVI